MFCGKSSDKVLDFYSLYIKVYHFVYILCIDLDITALNCIILYTFIQFYRIFFSQVIILNGFVYQLVQSSKMVFYFVQFCISVYTLKFIIHYDFIYELVYHFVHFHPILPNIFFLQSIILNSFVYQIVQSSKMETLFFDSLTTN